MSLLEAAVMTLAVMLLVLIGILFVCLGYAVWMPVSYTHLTLPTICSV